MIKVNHILHLLDGKIISYGTNPDSDDEQVEKMRNLRSLVLMFGNGWDIGVMPVNEEEAEDIALKVGMEPGEKKGFVELSGKIEWLLREGV